VKVIDSASHSGNVVVRFEGSEDRDAALKFRGMGVAVPRSELPPTSGNEIYQADLIGLAVVNEQGEQLGKVSGVFSNGGHDVLRVRHEGGERLVPYVPSVVSNVDLGSGVLRVDWGLDW
jgi:16S rRNA processing protein RimM